MTCVSITSFSISINCELHGNFRGRRGLRQVSVFVYISYGSVNFGDSTCIQNEGGFEIHSGICIK